MSIVVSTEPLIALEVDRLVGQLAGEAAGPTLLCTASLHGNEPAGLRALEKVFARLEAERPRMRGEFVGLVGNLSAVSLGERFVDSDLNRHWSPAKVAALRARRADALEDAEDLEAGQLLEEIDSAAARARGEVYCLDLHSTSGESPPFATAMDTLRNRRFALRFPVPHVLGLEEHLDHTLLDHLDGEGFITLGFEGGQHDDPRSVDHCEAAVWLALAETGVLIEPDGVPAVEEARKRLAAATTGLPQAVEVRYRHGLREDDGFEMLPGFVSFQTISEGDLLGRNDRGELRAPEGGGILMPLYQRQGDDGFFVIRKFSAFWLTVSSTLRQLRVDALLPLLPGVHRDRDRPGTLRIDRHVARFYALQIFHLAGYRKKRIEGDQLVVTRRKE
ncbi:MAG: succinylglutamate desuccinylase/aspartoacylase family protein [Gemmatimonadota bacterium]